MISHTVGGWWVVGDGWWVMGGGGGGVWQVVVVLGGAGRDVFLTWALFSSIHPPLASANAATLCAPVGALHCVDPYFVLIGALPAVLCVEIGAAGTAFGIVLGPFSHVSLSVRGMMEGCCY